MPSPDDQVVAATRAALATYETSGLTPTDRLQLWSTILLALSESELLVTRPLSRGPGRADHRIGHRYTRLNLTNLTPAQRIHLLAVSASDFTDPEWPSLLAEIVEDATA